jgi:hypothetical protein
MCLERGPQHIGVLVLMRSNRNAENAGTSGPLAWEHRLPRSSDQTDAFGRRLRPVAWKFSYHENIALIAPSLAPLHRKQGAKAFVIFDLGCCSGKSYTAAIQINP